MFRVFPYFGPSGGGGSGRELLSMVLLSVSPSTGSDSHSNTAQLTFTRHFPATVRKRASRAEFKLLLVKHSCHFSSSSTLLSQPAAPPCALLLTRRLVVCSVSLSSQLLIGSSSRPPSPLARSASSSDQSRLDLCPKGGSRRRSGGVRPTETERC